MGVLRWVVRGCPLGGLGLSLGWLSLGWLGLSLGRLGLLGGHGLYPSGCSSLDPLGRGSLPLMCFQNPRGRVLSFVCRAAGRVLVFHGISHRFWYFVGLVFGDRSASEGFGASLSLMSFEKALLRYRSSVCRAMRIRGEFVQGEFVVNPCKVSPWKSCFLELLLLKTSFKQLGRHF